jgi:hypothetical protein
MGQDFQVPCIVYLGKDPIHTIQRGTGHEANEIGGGHKKRLK